MRVLVADDERIARQRAIRLLAEMEDITVCGECSNADEVLAAVKQGDIDLVLLDIEMPGLSGIDALALLGDPAPHVIFCTAHADYAVRAYDGGAIDYVLKPVSAERLRKAVDRARDRSRPVRAMQSAGAERLAIATRDGVVLVDPRAVTHAVLDGELVTVFTAKAEYLTEDSLQELERKLPHMVRVHRRALVALDHVARLESRTTGGYVAHTTTGRAIEVSRQAARELRRKLGIGRP